MVFSAQVVKGKRYALTRTSIVLIASPQGVGLQAPTPKSSKMMATWVRPQICFRRLPFAGCKVAAIYLGLFRQADR
jgi:hypothetical protein